MARDDHHPRPLGEVDAALCALVQVATAPLALPPPAQAILKGNPNAKIPREPGGRAAAHPVVNREVRDVQAKLEEVAALLRIPQRKQWDKMQGCWRSAGSRSCRPTAGTPYCATSPRQAKRSPPQKTSPRWTSLWDSALGAWPTRTRRTAAST